MGRGNRLTGIRSLAYLCLSCGGHGANDKNVCVTLHYADDKIYCTAINYSDKTVENPLSFKDGYSVKENIYGDMNQINAFDAVIFTLSK